MYLKEIIGNTTEFDKCEIYKITCKNIVDGTPNTYVGKTNQKNIHGQKDSYTIKRYKQHVPHKLSEYKKKVKSGVLHDTWEVFEKFTLTEWSSGNNLSILTSLFSEYFKYPEKRNNTSGDNKVLSPTQIIDMYYKTPHGKWMDSPENPLSKHIDVEVVCKLYISTSLSKKYIHALELHYERLF